MASKQTPANKGTFSQAVIKVNKYRWIFALLVAIIVGPIVGVITILMIDMLFPIASATVVRIAYPAAMVVSTILAYQLVKRSLEAWNLAIIGVEPEKNWIKMIILDVCLVLPMVITTGLYFQLHNTHPKFMFANDKIASEFVDTLAKDDYDSAAKYFCSTVTDANQEKLQSITNYVFILELPSGEMEVKAPLEDYATKKPQTRRADGQVITLSRLDYSDRYGSRNKLLIVTEGKAPESCISYVGFIVRGKMRTEIGSTTIDKTKDSAFVEKTVTAEDYLKANKQ